MFKQFEVLNSSPYFSPSGGFISQPVLEPRTSLGVMPELVDFTTISLKHASSSLSVTPEPGSTPATAYNLGALTATPTKVTEAVNSSDIDYYKFTLSAASNFNLCLTGLSADADVQLLASDGTTQLNISQGYGSVDEAINHTLSGGTYYLKVYPWSGANTGYTLRVSATPPPLTTSPSNLLSVETDVGTLSGTRTFSNRVDNTDTADVFRFSLDGDSKFNLTLTGLSADADVRLIRDTNNNGIVEPNVVLPPYPNDEVLQVSRLEGNASEWISTALNAGTYFVQVYQYSGNTDYNLSLSTGDWYSQNLSDPGIIGLARKFAADGQLSRNDMISILRDTEDASVIDATELIDLRTLVSGRRSIMPDYVYNLSNKLVNGDPANAWWTGGAATRIALGNLVAGSGETQMERLIGKWFLGLDRPTASSNTTYRLASGSLFQGGISYSDIDQGNLGDCYLLASLAGTAFRSPTTINNMFIDNGDGTYTVRFYNAGVADYVTIDRYLPTYSSGSLTGRFYYANRDSGRLYNDSANELWVALAEKAYAQINESQWIGQDNINRYQSSDELEGTGIEGGTPAAISHITGLSNTGYIDPLNTSELIGAFNASRIIYLSDGGHAHTLVGYNSSTGVFTVYNPYGNTETYTSSGMTSKFVRFAYSGSRV